MTNFFNHHTFIKTLMKKEEEKSIGKRLMESMIEAKFKIGDEVVYEFDDYHDGYAFKISRIGLTKDNEFVYYETNLQYAKYFYEDSLRYLSDVISKQNKFNSILC